MFLPQMPFCYSNTNNIIFLWILFKLAGKFKGETNKVTWNSLKLDIKSVYSKFYHYREWNRIHKDKTQETKLLTDFPSYLVFIWEKYGHKYISSVPCFTFPFPPSIFSFFSQLADLMEAQRLM